MSQRKEQRKGQPISVREAGARGGRSTLEHRGVRFFQQIGRKGGRRTAELYGELLKEFGRRGGRPRRPNLLDTGEEHPDREGGSGRPQGTLLPPEF